jgi:hypothetical protein
MKKLFRGRMSKLLLLQVLVSSFYRQYTWHRWRQLALPTFSLFGQAVPILCIWRENYYLFQWEKCFLSQAFWQGKEENFLEDLILVPLVIFTVEKVCYADLSCYVVWWLFYLFHKSHHYIYVSNSWAAKGWVHINRYYYWNSGRYIWFIHLLSWFINAVLLNNCCWVFHYLSC